MGNLEEIFKIYFLKLISRYKKINNSIINFCPLLIFAPEPNHVISGSSPSQGDFLFIQRSSPGELKPDDLKTWFPAWKSMRK